MICINLKTYSEFIGPGLYNIFDQVEKFINDFPMFKNHLAIAPNMFQINEIAKMYNNINIIAQNTDPIDIGKTTGWIPPEFLKINNISYTLLNHSEHRIFDENINNKIQFIQSKNINVIVCCENIEEAKVITQSKPYAIAYEPPELIGTNISVSTQKEQTIKEFVDLVKDYSIPYIGAGIRTVEDIKSGKEYGAEGFIIAKAFNDADNKYEKLVEFLNAYV